MAVFADLTIELLVFILSFLSVKERLRVRRVNKALRDAGHPKYVKKWFVSKRDRLTTGGIKPILFKAQFLTSLAIHPKLCKSRKWNSYLVAIAAMDFCPRLTALSLSVDGSGLQKFLRRLHFSRVTNLAVYRSWDCQKFIDNAFCLQAITHLHLGNQSAANYINFVSSGLITAIATFCHRLVSLGIDDCPLTDSLNVLITSNSSTLKMLQLNCWLLPFYFFDTIISCKNLELLCLRETKALESDKFRELMALPHVKFLKIYDLIRVDEAEFIRAFEGLKQFTHVEFLNVSNLTDRSIAAFAQSCPNLVDFRIIAGNDGCPGITAASISTLLEKCPKIRFMQGIRLTNILNHYSATVYRRLYFSN